MKTSALLSAVGLMACSIAGFPAHAQGPAQPWRPISTTPPGEPDANAPVVLHPYQAQLQKEVKAGPQFKTTATASRLISNSELKPVNFVFTYVDSTVYAFSGGRGSDFESDDAQYDSYLTYKYSNGTAQFTTDRRGIFTYNAANTMTDNLSQKWDIPTQAWKNTYHTSYTYDAQNNLTIRISQSWDVNTAAWKNQDYLTYTYDGQGQLATYTRQMWDVNAAAWKNYSQEIFTHAGTLLQVEVEKMWDNNLAAWKNHRRTEYTYDAGDRLIKDKQFSWDANAGLCNAGGFVVFVAIVVATVGGEGYPGIGGPTILLLTGELLPAVVFHRLARFVLQHSVGVGFLVDDFRRSAVWVVGGVLA